MKKILISVALVIFSFSSVNAKKFELPVGTELNGKSWILPNYKILGTNNPKRFYIVFDNPRQKPRLQEIISLEQAMNLLPTKSECYHSVPLCVAGKLAWYLQTEEGAYIVDSQRKVYLQKDASQNALMKTPLKK